MGSTQLRSITKAITWETISFLVLLPINYLISGEITQSLKIALLYILFKIPIYYYHERSWKLITWGKT